VRRKKSVKKPRWIGRNANPDSMRRYCVEIWSEVVRARDGSCFLCGTKMGLVSHHLITKKWKRTAYDIDCGVALCKKCHISRIFSAHLSPWFLDKELKERRPDQYKWLLINRMKMTSSASYSVNYKKVLDTLMKEYEKIFPTDIVRSGYFKFSENEELQIVHEFRDLRGTARLISDKWGCSSGCISRILSSHGIDLKNEEYRRRNREMTRRICGHCVVKLDKEGNILEKYPSLNKAAQSHGVTINAIRNCVNGLSKSSVGFLWILEKDLECQVK